MLHCNMTRVRLPGREKETNMSKQLTLAAVLAVFASAATALIQTPALLA